jgi:hypothetical protein
MELNPQGAPTTPINKPVSDTPATPERTVESENYRGLDTQGAPTASSDRPVGNTLNPIINTGNIKGLTQVEYNDPNQIEITISDRENPIVILFGPAQCGKTMSLVRLTRYLKNQGYTVEPITAFRPSTDTHYASMCDSFNDNVNSRDAADSTKGISFMLVKVLDGMRRTICQILEAPGEYYFDPADPTAPFPAYVSKIIASKNRKIWCFMVEPRWKDQQDRDGYVTKIKNLKINMRKSDKAVFVFNKIDMTNFVLAPGHINEKEARKEVMNLYPGIFEPFRAKGVFWTSDNFKFVPFQTGTYPRNPNGGQFFDAGDDIYPDKLWKTILKLIRG